MNRLAPYTLGTISATNDSATITGTGTDWIGADPVLRTVAPGDFLLGPDANVYTITAVASGTSLTIWPTWLGATGSGLSYAITRLATNQLAAAVYNKLEDLSELLNGKVAGLRYRESTNVGNDYSITVDRLVSPIGIPIYWKPSADSTGPARLSINGAPFLPIFEDTGTQAGAGKLKATAPVATTLVPELSENGAHVLIGTQGPPGDDGATVRVGTAVPAPGLGSNGDAYFRLDASGNVLELYLKASGSWSVGYSLTALVNAARADALAAAAAASASASSSAASASQAQTARNDAQNFRNQAESFAATGAGHVTNSASNAAAAAGSAAAAASFAALLQNVDYGFITDIPTDTVDFGFLP